MALRKPLIKLNGRDTVLPNTETLDRVGDIWVDTTKKQLSELVRYIHSANADASGNHTFNLTTDGTASGAAIFSSILSIQGIVRFNTTVIKDAPLVYVKNISVNLKQLDVRAVTSGGAAAGTSHVIYIHVIGYG